MMRRGILLATLALLLSACSTAAARVNSVFDCTTYVQQPTALTLYCADAGQVLRDIRWFNWGELSATGEGIVDTNLCDPNCAEGEVVSTKVKITLLDARDVDGTSLFTTAQLLYAETPPGHPNVENVALATGR